MGQALRSLLTRHDASASQVGLLAVNSILSAPQHAQIQPCAAAIRAIGATLARASVLQPLEFLGIRRCPRIFRLRRDGVTTAGHRDHRDRRDRETRAVWGSSLAPTCTRACGFLHGQRCAESRSVVSGPLGGGSKLPRRAGNDNATPPQKNTAADASPRTMGPERSSWAADACDTRRKFPWSAQRFSILARPSALRHRAASLTTR